MCATLQPLPLVSDDYSWLHTNAVMSLAEKKGGLQFSVPDFSNQWDENMWGLFIVTQNWGGHCGSLSWNTGLYYTVAQKTSISPAHKRAQNSQQNTMIDLRPSRKDQDLKTMADEAEENRSFQKNTTIWKTVRNIFKRSWKWCCQLCCTSF